MSAEAANYDFAKVVIDAGALILSAIALGVSLFFWHASRSRASKVETAAKFEAVGKDMGALDTRVARVEEQLKAGPTHEDMKLLHSRVSEVKNSISSIAQNVASIGAKVSSQAEQNKSMTMLLQQVIDNELAEGRAAKEGKKT